jgi:16S rRNA (uracil1498-N3)-methyltransferase
MLPGEYRLTRLYFPGELAPGRECALPRQQARHATRVLRLKAGAVVTLFNGDGVEYHALVARVAGEAVTVRVGEARAGARESPLEIVLGQALSGGERMDYTVQKAVELGIAAIHPLAAARSVVRLAGERAEKRVAHWQAVAVAACEQCGRNRVPPVAPVAELAVWLARPAGGERALRLLLSPAGQAGLRELPRPAGAIVLLAGPEGGFTAGEEAAARNCGFTAVRLGPRVLRTETAAVAALAALQALWGDF